MNISMLILGVELPPDSSALPVLPGLSADQPEGENGLTNIEIPADIETNEVLVVELPADSDSNAPLLLSELQYTRRRRFITLTLENTFINGMNRNVQLFSEQPGFGFIGIMRTSTRRTLILSKNMQELGMNFDCIKESQRLLSDVAEGKLVAKPLPTAPTSEMLMNELELIDSDTLNKCIKIGREHYLSDTIPTDDLKRGLPKINLR
jgi:hypothetical protein